MDWNNYRKEIDSADFDPDFSQRAARQVEAMWQERKEPYYMKKTGKSLRVALVAACLTVLMSVTAAAAVIVTSFRQTAREELGIQAENPIPEYTEYAEEQNEENGMKLVSTVCSGTRMDAIFAMSHVPAEIGPIIDQGKGYEWDLGGISAHETTGTPSTSLVDQIDYDSESETALVHLTILSDVLPKQDTISVSLFLRGPAEDIPFGSIDVPVTKSQTLTATTDLTLSCGQVTDISIGVGFVEVSIAGAPITAKEIDVIDAEVSKRLEAINASLDTMTLQFEDGTEAKVTDLPSPLAANWMLAGESLHEMEQGQFRMQHICEQMLDIQTVVSVTIDGTVIRLR